MLAKSKNTKPCVIFREAKKKVSNDFGLAAKVISEMFPNESYDIFCASEDWYAQYINEENSP